MEGKSVIQAIEAVIDEDGEVRLLEPLPEGAVGRALVVILDQSDAANEAALLSEQTLQDWNRPEEDAAWSHLQSGK